MLSQYPAQATLPAQDMARAKSFYSETLGLEMESENPAALMYACGDGTGLTVFESSGKPSGDHTQAGFRVDDIEKVVGELRNRGVTFEEYEALNMVDGIADMGPVRAAYFHDSEGNLLGIVQFVQ